jgi:hypothetical protein
MMVPMLCNVDAEEYYLIVCWHAVIVMFCLCCEVLIPQCVVTSDRLAVMTKVVRA